MSIDILFAEFSTISVWMGVKNKSPKSFLLTCSSSLSLSCIVRNVKLEECMGNMVERRSDGHD